MHPCLVCGMVDEEKAMCFKGEDWCCERHRKIVMGELPAEEDEEQRWADLNNVGTWVEFK